LQIFQNGGWIRKWKSIVNRGKVRRTAGQLLISGQRLFHLFVSFLKLFLKEQIELIHGKGGTGGFLDEPGIILPPVGLLGKSSPRASGVGKLFQPVCEGLPGGQDGF